MLSLAWPKGLELHACLNASLFHDAAITSGSRERRWKDEKRGSASFRRICTASVRRG
jgi:hypothetical protein